MITTSNHKDTTLATDEIRWEVSEEIAEQRRKGATAGRVECGGQTYRWVADQAEIPDGVYFLSPEGCAWIAARFRGNKLVGRTEEANADTHAAASDRWAGIVPDKTDTEVGDLVGDLVIAAAMGDDTDPSCVVVTMYDGDLRDMIATLQCHGDRFTGVNTADEARGWMDEGFDADSADAWCEIGVWDAETAAKLRDADLSPEQVQRGAEALIEQAGDDAADEYTDGDPIYSVCNSDTSVQVLIDATQEAIG